jgi:P27 family predicted phage terminase small subunit
MSVFLGFSATEVRDSLSFQRPPSAFQNQLCFCIMPRKSRASLDVVRFPMANDRSEPMFDPPPPPAHLGEPERLIWASVFADFKLETGASIAVLKTALEAHQCAREARERIKADGMVVAGRDGQIKAHPLLATERDARQAWLYGLRTLGLDL